MSKYNRHSSVISRNADSQEGESHWLDQFEKKLQKGAVQPRHEDSSLFDQINSVMNGSKSRHSSVAAAVEDMQERSGLKAYLEKINKQSEEDVAGKKKTASDENEVLDKKVPMTDTEPVVIKKCPQIKNTFKNYIRDSHGNSSIPAILDKIKSIHRGDVSDDKDWSDDKLIVLISKMNLNAKKNNPSNYESYNNLGSMDVMNDTDIDPANSDAFHALMPNTK